MNWTAIAHMSLVAVLTLVAACGNTSAPQISAEQRSASVRSEDSVAITNVTLVDVVSGAKEAGMTVVTRTNRIADIGRGTAIPEGATRVDGTGKFLIPGLWDMHSHHQATGTESLDLFLANGVVGTRDMGADVDFILPLRNRINAGEMFGPEIVAAGPILDDRPPDWPFRRRVTNGHEAREAVRDLKNRGVDFIKVHDSTPREAYFAIAEEAPKVGLSFSGHVPFSVTIEEAADSAIKSIEHLANNRVFRECSGKEPYSAASCQPLFDKLAAKGVWQTPTMAFFQEIPDVFSGKPLRHAEYASDSLLELTRKNVEVSKLDERALSSWRANAKTALAAIHDLYSRGSRVLAGCDGIVPGFCLHDELEWMTEAGLSPLQAIQTATINPARFLGREKTQGTIEAGKRADLILLEADPLTDIRHTRRIAAVLVRGRLLSKPDIDRIVANHRRAPRTP
jgi:Amidohydrolase family